MKIKNIGLSGLFLFFLLINIAKADLTVNSGFYSEGGNIYYSANMNSEGGDVDVIIDGINMFDTLTTLSESVDTELTTLSQSVNTELNTLYTSVDGSFDAYSLATYIGRVTDVVNGYSEGNELEQQMAYDLSNTFLTKDYLDYIQYNSFRLDIIETFLIRNFPNEYCDVVKEFVKKNGFKRARCGNATIIRTSYGTLTVKDFPEEAKDVAEVEGKSNFVEEKNNAFRMRVKSQYESNMQRYKETNNQYFYTLAENLKKSYPNFFL